MMVMDFGHRMKSEINQMESQSKSFTLSTSENSHATQEHSELTWPMLSCMHMYAQAISHASAQQYFLSISTLALDIILQSHDKNYTIITSNLEN